MNDQDKKEIRKIFNEGIEQLVLPHFDEISKKFDEVDKRFDEVDKRFVEVYKRFDRVDEDIIDLRGDVGRIEKKLDAEIAWGDRAEKRLKKVEIKLGFTK